MTDDIPPGETQKRPRGRPKMASDDSRRVMVIDCARKTFVELGFAGTTTDIVAARCKISKQTLYRLFASKSELFLAIVIAHRQMMLDLPRPAGEDLPVVETLARIFRLDIDEAADREREAFVHLVIRESTQFPEIGDMLYRDGLLQSLHLLADWLTQQTVAGRMQIDDSLSGARMLMDMIFGGKGPPGPARRDWLTSETRPQHLRRCLEIFARGTRPL